MREAECGVCSPIGDAQSLAEAVMELSKSSRLAEYGKNSRAYFEAHFDKKMLLDRFDEYIYADGQAQERRQ